jgi:hypothetical protein
LFIYSFFASFIKPTTPTTQQEIRERERKREKEGERERERERERDQ